MKANILMIQEPEFSAFFFEDQMSYVMDYHTGYTCIFPVECLSENRKVLFEENVDIIDFAYQGSCYLCIPTLRDK